MPQRKKKRANRKMEFLRSIFLFINFSIIFNQFVLDHVHVSAKEVISPGGELSSLNSTSYLVSDNGIFTLGFFTANSFTYIGIWYTNFDSYQKVWVANRDMPIMNDSSGVLLMDDWGTLKIVYGSGATFFTIFNNQVGTGNKTRAMLEDSGNFVIYDAGTDKDRILWQCYDHPTDTLIPSMKLGYNLTMKQNWTLLSSSDYVVPTFGAFTMSLEQYQNSPQLIIHRNGEVYWASGPWKNGTFQFGNFISLQNTSLVSDASGMYIAFPTMTSSSNLQLSPDGQLIENADFIVTGFVTQRSCFGNQSNDGCMLFHSPPQKNDNGKTWNFWRVFQVAIAPTLVVACLCYVIFRRLRLKGQEKGKRDEFIHHLTGSNSFNYGDELEKGIKDAPHIKIFSLKAILAATNNFSNENKLGQGGYGPVYKGKLFDGREIAVKRLSKASGQGIEQFKSELILISKLQHTNLVRLYGCCIHQEEKMLIYELMPNKSLDFFLFDDNEKGKIDWRIRFNIIEGIAQGLLYLHKYCRMRVIHKDLKVSNILLDKDMNPKIADFGMARTFQQNVTEAMTKRVVGTYGYMAPEYAMHGAFSIKSDVFSFGVLILEIISDKRNSSFYDYDRPLNLVGYAWKLWKREAALELKDEALGDSYDMKQLLRGIHIGLLCVQEKADERPTMSEVMLMLNNEIVDLSNPKQPAFFTQPIDVQSTDHLLGNDIQVSVNGSNLTTMGSR